VRYFQTAESSECNSERIASSTQPFNLVGGIQPSVTGMTTG
jgi:hypothetical protein